MSSATIAKFPVYDGCLLTFLILNRLKVDKFRYNNKNASNFHYNCKDLIEKDTLILIRRQRVRKKSRRFYEDPSCMICV